MDNKTNKHEFACNAGKITEYEVKEHIDTIMVGFRGFSKYAHSFEEQQEEVATKVNEFLRLNA